MKGRTRPNGAGTAYKRGRTWTACITIGWKTTPTGRAQAIRRTKGGFSTKRDALAYCQQLQAAPREKPKMTLQQVIE